MASNDLHMSISTHVKRELVKTRSLSYMFTANVADIVTHQAPWATLNLGKNCGEA